MGFKSCVRKLVSFGFVLFVSATTTQFASAEDSTPRTAAPMDNQRLEVLISRVGDNVEGRPGFWQFMVEKREVMVITDERANRMRIIAPVISADKISDAEMKRLMQANFDSALDARYAIARGALWSAFVHPLSSLSDKEFLSALGQVINLVATYGSSYASGGLTFNGGDTKSIERRKLIERLINKGLAI